LFKDGINIVQFFGHASSSTLDYNLDNPELMTNYQRYPVFIANGCGVGNVFILNSQRTLGEKFVLSPVGGSIAFIASDNTGLSDKLGTYTDSLYKQFGITSYGKNIGTQILKNIASLNLSIDPLLRQHAEQIILNGDPATSMHHFSKPDYAVEAKSITLEPLNLTTNLDSFDVNIVVYNLGQYKKDSVSIYVKRTLPNGIENTILLKNYPGIAYSDTLHLRIPVQGNLAIGDNSIDIILDQEGFIDEVSESNNTYKKVFAIYNDDLVPVYPYDFGIVGTQGVTLKGSTLNPFAPLATYLFQIDTTEKFNSPLFTSTSITEKGGVIKWQPSITLRDSTVYYWRTAMDISPTNPTHKWSYSSFIYLDGSAPGWNQSHYFQFQKNRFTDINLDSTDRRFSFYGVNKKLLVQNVCLYSPAPYYYSWPDYRVKLNGSTLYTDGCDPPPGYSSLQFMVIDTLSGTPWINTPVGTEGRFGSYKPCRVGTSPNYVDPFFEFNFSNTSWRKKIMDFLDSIPTGYYIMMQPRLCTGTACGSVNKAFVSSWKADTTLYGSSNSLYHKIYNLGFTKIDSFYKNRPMIFFGKKNVLSSVQQEVEADSTKILAKEFSFTTYLFEGEIGTSRIGPSKKWDMFKRRGTSLDAGIGDSVMVDIYGMDLNNVETFITSVQGDTSLAFIDAKTYPYLRFVMKNRDNNFSTPEQLKNWRILYQLVPEAALNPNRHFVFTDSVKQGQTSRFEVAVENLTELPLDSMLIHFDMIDKNKVRKTLAAKRYSTISAYDTIHVAMDINSREFPDNNIFAVEANPNNDQIEQYHPNNIGFLNYYVAPDKQNPLIDVTFDGVHIMDKDIVSSKPNISILLRDENPYLPLDDTLMADVFMRYPGDNPTAETRIPFDGNILKFYPADLTDGKSKNIARIEFRPTFLVDGNDYILTVKGKDKSGNLSSINSYKVGFEVVNKPAISSVVNYPNPFTTSTQFVFTITGSEIPSNLKIQILSQTGKIVKEILKSDLGPLHIGTNITEYKWKGDDQYGQPLGNGVYLYRVISNLNGEKMDHYKKSESQNADKWIEKGFGKLYIMR
ncbi:MAG TPA: C25 family cysteine peptidase, partial [Chitinophagaceae bacterium]|nr:C25 family cysteine peptidase [Chitinophagaceae bacterium]